MYPTPVVKRVVAVLLLFLLILTTQVGRSFDDLSLLTDEFDDAATLSQWQRVYQAEGWAAVDRTLGRLRLTHDLIHLDRSSAETPSPDLPASPFPLSYRLVDQDSLGELGVQIVVSELTGKDNLGLQAGDGWLADTLLRYEPSDAPVDPARNGVTQWIIRWQTPRQAGKFSAFYRRGLEKRHGDRWSENGRFTLPGDRFLTIRTTESAVLIQVGPASLLPPAAPTAEGNS